MHGAVQHGGDAIHGGGVLAAALRALAERGRERRDAHDRGEHGVHLFGHRWRRRTSSKFQRRSGFYG